MNTQTKDPDHLDVKKLVASAESDETPKLLRNDNVLAIGSVPSYEAIQKLKTDHKRGDLVDVLPPEYWDIIKDFGPPDPTGDPHLEGTKAAICLVVCNVVRLGLKMHEKKLHDVEVVEGTCMRIFAKLSKANNPEK